MNNLKITTNYVDGRLADVVLNGEDIGNKITGLTLDMKGGKTPKALIEFPLSEVEVNGEFEVVKKIPEENKKVKKEKINNKYTKFAEKINALAETVEELAVMEDKDSKGVDISNSEAYALMGKFMMQIMELQQGIPE